MPKTLTERRDAILCLDTSQLAESLHQQIVKHCMSSESTPGHLQPCGQSKRWLLSDAEPLHRTAQQSWRRVRLQPGQQVVLLDTEAAAAAAAAADLQHQTQVRHSQLLSAISLELMKLDQKLHMVGEGVDAWPTACLKGMAAVEQQLKGRT
jgi:hypothetical protein